MNIHEIGHAEWVEIIAPHMFSQTETRHDSIFVVQEKFKDGKLSGGQFNRLASPGYLAANRIKS
jgi:hypothetical protein